MTVPDSQGESIGYGVPCRMPGGLVVSAPLSESSGPCSSPSSPRRGHYGTVFLGKALIDY